jgi:hypothetical protein
VKVKIQTGVVSALLLASLTGCASSRKQVEVWEPKPIVAWYDIAPVEVQALVDHYRIVVTRPTKGLFPANIGVTRVGLLPLDSELRQVVPVIRKDPRNEFLRWNASFDDQMAISEVFPIDQFDLGGGIAEPEQIVAAFNALDARLGLVYAVNELNADETEIIGVIYDVPAFRPIAYLHTSAKSIVPVDPKSKGGAKVVTPTIPVDQTEADEHAQVKVRESASKEPPNLWETDSKALARRKFEQMLYACMFELIQFDEPEVVDVPDGWKPVAPARPAAWPPRQRLRGY